MIKRLSIVTLLLLLAALLIIMSTLWLSLPKLDGTFIHPALQANATLERDDLGTAVITADNRKDIAFTLGLAHAQDRLFQMDLLRRSAAGELSELFGERATEVDKSRRFHQFRKRATDTLARMPADKKYLLNAYRDGVNAGIASLTTRPFEYWLLGADVRPWQAEDSLLVSYAMYIDLQLSQVNRDLALTVIEQEYGPAMLDFIMQPSNYQAALDGSEYPIGNVDIPALERNKQRSVDNELVQPDPDVGSNNWAVTGELTASGHAMLADDMHLSLRVPVIWYRSQFNLSGEDEYTITGLTLPGAPLMVVGSNGNIAWGFTNANLDNADWLIVSDETESWIEKEIIALPDGEHSLEVELTAYGPVKQVAGQRYALVWTAHQDYAVNLSLIDMESADRVEQALQIAPGVGIPLQNLVVVDRHGSAAWTPMGGLTARQQPALTAYPDSQFDPRWSEQETRRPVIHNPDNNRLWTANARVMSTKDMRRFGNGGYAVGARAKQIRDRMFAQTQFDESDFYRLQQDNEARFMLPWHALLTDLLRQSQDEFALDLQSLNHWQGCACPDSVGYTLVRHYRTEVINALFAPLQATLNEQDLSLSPVIRHLEPATWQLLNDQPSSWLPEEQASWQSFLTALYRDTKERLLEDYDKESVGIASLRWGDVNALSIQHPLASSIPLLGSKLNMPEAQGFGDSFVPAVQRRQFGASQRLVVQPGREQDAILTVPGGQSAHPMSAFYTAGFADYVDNGPTPLLPGESIHRLELEPAK